MMDFNIEETDLEQIESLLKINTNIDRLYNKICDLEINGKSDTEEYKKIIEYLNIFIEGEEKIYNDSSVTGEKLLSWAKFLFIQKRQNCFDIKENIMIQNYDNRIYSRIIHTILSKLSQNYSNLINLSNKELINIMTMSGMNITKKLNNDDISKRIIIKNYIEDDIYYSFLSLLQEQIEDTSQRIFREKIIIAKYNTIFINKDIESYLLKNNFIIKTNTYISSNIIADLLQDQNLNTLSKNVLGATIVNEEIYELLEITDIEYNNITKATTSILRQCMINASLLFISDDTIEEIRNIINEYIKNEEYEIIYPNSTISNNLIDNCFKNVRSNKEKMKILSLK